MQKLVPYPGAKDWWTLEPDTEGKPAGDRNGGKAPIWMERVESTITFRTKAKKVAVYPLTGSGQRCDALAAKDVKPVRGGYEIHLQADGQRFAPWYEVSANW